MIRNLAKYYPGDQVKKSEMGGQVVLKGKRGVGQRVLVGAYDGKSTLGTPARDGTFKKQELEHELA